MSALSGTQITGLDHLATVLHLSPGAAKARVSDALRMVRDLPHTLQRLEAGELTGYVVRKIIDATIPLTATQASALDEQVSGRPFTTGNRAGLGAGRAQTRTVTRRVDAAVIALGAVPETTRKRQAGFAGRYVRFGKTTDGMTNLHGSVPALQAVAIDTLLNDLAATAHDATTPESGSGAGGGAEVRTVEQRRADAFLTCFTGPAALAPAARSSADMTIPVFDEDGGYAIVDEAQNDTAQAIWHTLRLLAASLDLTIPDPGRAHLDVTVPLPVTHGRQRSRAGRHRSRVRYRRPARTIPPPPMRPTGRDPGRWPTASGRSRTASPADSSTTQA